MPRGVSLNWVEDHNGAGEQDQHGSGPAPARPASPERVAPHQLPTAPRGNGGDSSASSDDRAARFARALAAGMIEAGLLALAAALLIAASPTTPIELVTQPPLLGR